MQDTFFPQVMPDCSALFQKFCGQLLKIGIIMKAKLMLHFLHYKKPPRILLLAQILSRLQVYNIREINSNITVFILQGSLISTVFCFLFTVTGVKSSEKLVLLRITFRTPLINTTPTDAQKDCKEKYQFGKPSKPSFW